MEVETVHQNGYGSGGDDSRESSVERELNGDIKAVELNGGSASPSGQNGHMKKPNSVGLDNHDNRVKRKAKRLIQRQNSRGESNGAAGLPAAMNGQAKDYIVPHRRWKNSRRSRGGYGRGLPKKGGAGGKGVWGLPGSEALEELVEDENDPNYDSETNDQNVVLTEVIPELTPQEFFKLAEPIVLEYYEHGDTHEVAVNLDEILTGLLRPYVTSVIVEISMDHKDSQREMTSVLISDLYGRVITSKDIEKGFEILLENLPDLILDTPEAPTILGKYKKTRKIKLTNEAPRLQTFSFFLKLNYLELKFVMKH